MFSVLEMGGGPCTDLKKLIRRQMGTYSTRPLVLFTNDTEYNITIYKASLIEGASSTRRAESCIQCQWL